MFALKCSYFQLIKMGVLRGQSIYYSLNFKVKKISMMGSFIYANFNVLNEKEFV